MQSFSVSAGRPCLAVLCAVCLTIPFCLSPNLHAGGFALGGGLSLPNNEINNVYNSEEIRTGSDDFGQFLRESASIGFHIGARYYIDLDEEFSLVFGLGINRFMETRIDVYNEERTELLAVLQSTQNIVPISVGLDYPIFRSFAGLYLAGDLQYNYIFNTVDIVKNDVAIPFADTPSDNRVGASLGMGIEFDLALLTLDMGIRFNHANLIGKETAEGDKTYLTFNVSVLFGEKSEEEEEDD